MTVITESGSEAGKPTAITVTVEPSPTGLGECHLHGECRCAVWGVRCALRVVLNVFVSPSCALAVIGTAMLRRKNMQQRRRLMGTKPSTDTKKNTDMKATKTNTDRKRMRRQRVTPVMRTRDTGE